MKCKLELLQPKSHFFGPARPVLFFYLFLFFFYLFLFLFKRSYLFSIPNPRLGFWVAIGAAIFSKSVLSLLSVAIFYRR